MSTFALGPVLIVTAFAAVAAFFTLRPGGPAQPATRPLRTDRGRATARDIQRSMLMATAADVDRRSPRTVREWFADAFGWRGPEPALRGPDARTPWWRRVRSVILLFVLLALLGTALAAAIGAVIFLAGFLLELATR